jgi:hypothetical protein
MWDLFPLYLDLTWVYATDHFHRVERQGHAAATFSAWPSLDEDVWRPNARIIELVVLEIGKLDVA